MQGWPESAHKYQSYNLISLGDENTPVVPLNYNPRHEESNDEPLIKIEWVI